MERCLSEQTIVEGGTRRLREKKKDSFPKAMMQSPTDPDATYREKAGKKYRGYEANVEEAVDSSGSVIVDYQLEQNIYSDSQFLQDCLAGMEQQADMNCPHKEEYRVKEHKKVCSFTISLTAGYRAKAKRFMKTEEFSLLSRIRNGIETVPSAFKKEFV